MNGDRATLMWDNPWTPLSLTAAVLLLTFGCVQVANSTIGRLQLPFVLCTGKTTARPAANP